MPQTTLLYKMIATVWPVPSVVIRRPYAPDLKKAGSSAFTLPVYTIEDRDRAKPPRFLKVWDCYQAKMDPNERVNVAPEPVESEIIVDDLLKHWRVTDFGAPAEFRPGIWMVEGTREKPDEPTEKEIKRELAIQEGLMEWLYNDARRLIDGKRHNDLTPRHHMAAKWLKREELLGLVSKETELCPWCRQPIDPLAIVCAKCARQVKAPPPELARFAQAVKA